MFKLLSLLSAIIIILFLSACNKDDGTNIDYSKPKGYMTASITGAFDKNFNSDKITCLDNVLEIYASKGDTSNYMGVTISLHSALQLGTQSQTFAINKYNANSSGNYAWITQKVNGTILAYNATSGSIFITENSTSLIKGTFSFTGIDTTQSVVFNVSNGNFVAYK